VTAALAVTVCSRPGAAAVENEDAHAASERAVAVVDGLTSPAGMSSGCTHGTAWFARSLAVELVVAAAVAADSDLRPALEHTLASIAARHRGTCDLTMPGTPSAAVGLLCGRGDRVDYLVLSDVTILVDCCDGPLAVTDDRCSQLLGTLPEQVMRLPGGSPEREEQLVRLVTTQRGLRNVPGGYWVAGAIPEAARHAVVGSVERGSVRGAALLTDGAARLVDVFAAMNWAWAMESLRQRGPGSWIDETRRLEDSDPDMTRWPRLKSSDDATVAVVRLP
jgi:hypothetical protein